MSDSFGLPPPTRFVEYGLETKLEASRTALQVYLSLLDRPPSGDPGLGLRIKQQSEIVLENLRPLEKEVANIGKEAEANRLRNWGVGGGIASFSSWVAPWVANALFPADAVSQWTEHALDRSSHLLIRNLERARSRCKSATTFALVAFAVCFVLQNELVIRVSRSISFRLSSLYTGVESREQRAVDANSDELDGWRWKLLQWAR
ncbi:hypothetical protein EDB81DRAFT_802066 [Dactylonectria macrodidyma]|uniref:Uncharacterized protein n=1 Tax=Dactylonectria macrodidyma TaxID=307937 RepID=A0A9P9EH03_9HYPO|nr:hypothetical protein EDB81DRAFT_802066 [Dactylonectria macrodidyma]